MEKISIFLSDWQVLFREGIHFTLCGEEGLEVIGEATSAGEALPLIESNPPRIAILNINQGKPGGIDATRRIKHSLPAVSVILLMDEENEEQLYDAMKSGASACITKNIEPDELIRLVMEVAQGKKTIREVIYRPQIASRVLREFESLSEVGQEAASLLSPLNERETEILRRMSEGYSIERTAEVTGVNESAVSYQLELVLQKLVTNEHDREIIEAARGKPPETTEAGVPAAPAAGYLTREEFNAFRIDLQEQLRRLIESVRAREVTDNQAPDS